MTGITVQDIEVQEAKLRKYQEMIQKDEKGTLEEIENSWKGWLKRYETRLHQETLCLKGKETEDLKIKQKSRSLEELRLNRINKMNQTNPVYVLWNYMAQEAIDEAEKGNYKKVEDLLDLLSRPFEEREDHKQQEYKKCSPKWAGEICVSCSS